MSRGLSQQQKTILGIAVHVNRITNEGHIKLKDGQICEGYRVPTVNYKGVADINWILAAHIIHGLEFTERFTKIEKSNGVSQEAGYYFDLTTKQVKSIKATTIRAITGLINRGYFIYAPHAFNYGGCVLTAEGISTGIEYEQPFDSSLCYRAGLLTKQRFKYEFFKLYEQLLANEISISDILEKSS